MLLALVVDPPLAEFPNPGRKIKQDFQSCNNFIRKAKSSRFIAPMTKPLRDLRGELKRGVWPSHQHGRRVGPPLFTGRTETAFGIKDSIF